VSLLSTYIRGVDVAHDEAGGALVVGGVNYVYAQCLAADGSVVNTFLLKPAGANNIPFASFPRARFNPSAQNYLVVWPEEQSGGSLLVKARTINCPGGSMGAEHTIGSMPWGESGAALDWSPTSSKYLVAWKSIVSPNFVYAQLVEADGSPAGGPIQLSSAFGRDPGVAWNPTTNEFGVSYSGETSDGAYSVFVVVPASNPGAFRRTSFNTIGNGSKTYLTDLAYNTSTQRWIMSWFQLSGGSFAKIAEFDNSGNLVAMGTASTSIGSYDALSVAFNRNSGTFLLAGIDGGDQLRVAELNARGVRFASEQTFATGFNPIRYPRVSGSSSASSWFTAMSRGSSAGAFQGIGGVVFQTGTSGGGPAGGYDSAGGGSTGGGGSTTPGACTSVQPGPNWTCVNGNWLPPTDGGGSGGGGTTTGGCTSVQPGAGWTCVNGSWLPPTTGGGSTGGSTSSCTSVQPGTGWVCVNGNWLPPGSGGGSTGGGSTSSCTSVQPGTGWVCVIGNWLPPGSGGGSTGGGSTSSCTSVQPGSNWVCVNGNWLPPGSGGGSTGGGSTSSCTSVQPGTGWVCISGSWFPPGTGGSSTGTTTNNCTSVQPGVGWVCQNGGWLPPGSTLIVPTISCTTVRPGAGWVCQNGGWLPPASPLITGGGTSSPSTDGTCSGSAPVAGWVCRQGSWLPPDHPLVIGG
jgi:hypothetical protein